MTKILVIEDEVSVRENLVDLLEANDYEAICAENGYIGAIWASEHIPDLIICDVMMPEVNGHEVLEALRQSPTTAMIPFIFLTAMSDTKSIRKGMELGADDYLTKPFESIDLLKSVEIKLKKKADLEKIQEQRKQGEALSKILVAVHMLKNLKPGKQRDNFLKIIGNLCDSEIELLRKTPELGQILSSEDLNLFLQLR
ncbi:response regulator transcription factor [Altericista sp. CCNU0014]|uniref:response regulator transcription factor n=1 Tax=Altericista sp. CCNU0014 TaxID=3082949 RepID=UPI00384DC2FC